MHVKGELLGHVLLFYQIIRVYIGWGNSHSFTYVFYHHETIPIFTSMKSLKIPISCVN